MRRSIRNEAGQLEMGAGILILIGILAIPLAIAGAKDVYDAATGKWRPKDPVAVTPTVTIPTFGPALPPVGDARRECYLNRAGSLVYKPGEGWTHPAYPKPQLTGDQNIDRGRVDAYVSGLAPLVKDANFEECDRAPEKLKPSAPDPPEDDVNVSGTYQVTLSYQGGPPTQCNTAGYTQQYRISQPGKGRLSIATGGDRSFTGGLQRSGSFEATSQYSDSMRGQFRTSPGRVFIDSGFVSFAPPDGDTPCAYTFVAERVGG